MATETKLVARMIIPFKTWKKFIDAAEICRMDFFTEHEFNRCRTNLINGSGLGRRFIGQFIGESISRDFLTTAIVTLKQTGTKKINPPKRRKEILKMARIKEEIKKEEREVKRIIHFKSLIEKEQEEEQEEQLLYLLDCGKAVKIGITNNVQHRITCLQSGNPYEIKLIGLYKSKYGHPAKFEESVLLYELRHKRSKRGGSEWFFCSFNFVERKIKKRMERVEIKMTKEIQQKKKRPVFYHQIEQRRALEVVNQK